MPGALAPPALAPDIVLSPGMRSPLSLPQSQPCWESPCGLSDSTLGDPHAVHYLERASPPRSHRLSTASTSVLPESIAPRCRSISGASTIRSSKRSHFAPTLVTSVATYAPFASPAAHPRGGCRGAGDDGAAAGVAVVPAAGRGALAAVEREESARGERFVRYVFNVVADGEVVHTVADRYSVLRRAAQAAFRVCPALPDFPPRRWWRDNTACDRHVRQRADELLAWLRAVLVPDAAAPPLAEACRYAAAIRFLSLKRRSRAARLLRDVGRRQRAVVEGVPTDGLSTCCSWEDGDGDSDQE